MAFDVLVHSVRVDEIFRRVWEDIVGRSAGPANFRLFVQPAMATIFAIRAGIRDAREGRPPFFWAALTHQAPRRDLLQQGWKDIRNLFALTIILDSLYQLIVQRGVFLLELLVVAIALAIVPYILIRGPVTRFESWRTRRTGKNSGTFINHGSP